MDSDKVALRGWYQSDGMAVTDVRGGSPISLLQHPSDPIARCSGFFHVTGTVRSAVFVVRSELYFQIDDRRWHWLRDAVRIRHRPGHWIQRDSVVVYANGERQFKAKYESAASRAVKACDVTFDGMDQDEDWWRWLARIVAKPKHREHLVERWNAGI